MKEVVARWHRRTYVSVLWHLTDFFKLRSSFDFHCPGVGGVRTGTLIETDPEVSPVL